MVQSMKLVLAVVLLGMWAVVPATLIAQEDVDAVGISEDAPVARDVTAREGERTLEDLWKDMIHYVRVARPDLAAKFAQEIIQGEYADRDIYSMSITYPGSRNELIRASRLPEMREEASRILSLIESGYEGHRADPDQIARSIEQLGGNLSEYTAASRRLITSGEYAMPQMIARLRDPSASKIIKDRIVTVLPRMGRDAVRPMAVALQTDDPMLQRILASALGRIGYPHAAPRLKELLERPGIVDAVRDAARSALIATAGEQALEKPLAELYYDWAVKYYYSDDSLQPDARYELANVWYWENELGVTYRTVPRQALCDIYAMRYARIALQNNPQLEAAVPIWLSAILNKQANWPEGVEDPTWRDDLRGADFYMLAAGARFQQDVLARALDDRNTPVAYGAIGALANTAGAPSLVQPLPGGAQPLVQALTYPELKVRLLAGLSLAHALPQESFNGKDLVIPALNDAARLAGTARAVVVSGNQDTGNRVKAVLRDMGFDVIHTDLLQDALIQARQTSGIDLLVLAQVNNPREILSRLQMEAVLIGSAAIVIPTERESVPDAPRISVLPSNATDQDVQAAVQQAVEVVRGADMTEDRAAQWAIDAANAVRLLGTTRTTVFEIKDATAAMAELLAADTAAVQLAGAGALAVINLPAAQQALAAKALDEQADEAIRVGAFGAATESVRLFGNMLTDAQGQAVVETVNGSGAPAIRDAAAQLLGALNLPSERVRSLIVDTAPTAK